MSLWLAHTTSSGCPLQILAADEARYKAEMLTEQDIFRDTVGDLNVVRGARRGNPTCTCGIFWCSAASQSIAARAARLPSRGD